ncbi:universal stress family protein [Corallococcus coralloides DSM 2259]|uniref:Universal stress family protein n=1 Tax=Corallococcus coralloides (strain ATCC 25202 / DSM 2259 / NBRC 100086 / M2) TaxID=1144275 RepID=H8MXW6_CORCM|nr:universal stress protein [Corallococcus coralloides]AFE07096.1 universal stress family protein [Corallococcus coralloides DSM 2259]
MNIACTTNFSDASRRTGDTAALLARRLNASLLLVHAVPGNVARTFGARASEAVEGALQEEARRLESLSGVSVEPVVRTGEVEKALSALVTERDLKLVMSAAPREETPFLGLGGTVDRMAQALTVPFLVVRESEALEAWARGERPLRVMVGLDRSRPYEVARDWVKALSRFGPLEVVGGRIFWVSEEAKRLGLVHPRSYKDVSLDLREVLEREADSLLEPLRMPGVTVRARLEPGLGRVADHLVALAEEEHVDVLVVGTHHRKALARLWSVSQHARRLASMSVVSVPVLTAEQGSVKEPPQVRAVLATTDFTEPGDRAVAYAFALTPPGGTVHLLHVEPADASPEAVQAARRQLELRVPETEQEGRHKVELSVLKGDDVAGVITQAAERYCVDLLCLGTHGRTGVSRAVLGSVAQQVMARSDRPAVTVRMPRA